LSLQIRHELNYLAASFGAKEVVFRYLPDAMHELIAAFPEPIQITVEVLINTVPLPHLIDRAAQLRPPAIREPTAPRYSWWGYYIQDLVDLIFYHCAFEKRVSDMEAQFEHRSLFRCLGRLFFKHSLSGTVFFRPK
jgi:hypothetical protein